MAKFIVKGGNILKGEVKIGGAKNSILALIPATLLADDEIVIENVPDISDVKSFAKILKEMGVKVDHGVKKDTIKINGNSINSVTAQYDEIKRMRASYYLLGALLGKHRQAKVALPGGDDIGSRPIDQHIKGFKALGAEVDICHGYIDVKCRQLKGAYVYLDVISVGATINIMMAAVLAEGTTVIENAAKEPHIVDLANFLNTMGAQIRGAGTDVVKIKGVKRLNSCRYSVIPDQIEAGTYMIAATATKGKIYVTNIIPKHMEPITAKLIECGAKIEVGDDWIKVDMPDSINPISIKTLPYPGFPTDLQQPFTSLLTMAKGTSYITENIWDGRFKHIDELVRMGANIRIEGKTAVVNGVDKLYGVPVYSSDIRAGAALVIAAIMAQGQSEVHDIEHVERGYEEFVNKFKGLGADICRQR